MAEDNFARLKTAFDRLTVAQATDVAAAEGLTITRKDRRLRTVLFAKWKGQDAFMREKLIQRTDFYLAQLRQ